MVDIKTCLSSSFDMGESILFVQGEEAIRYLEYCVQQMHVKDESIHNYLLSLYAKLKPDRLMKYLNAQGQVPPT